MNYVHVTYKGRRYRVAEDGEVQQWRTMTGSFELGWCSFTIGDVEDEVRKLAGVEVSHDD